MRATHKDVELAAGVHYIPPVSVVAAEGPCPLQGVHVDHLDVTLQQQGPAQHLGLLTTPHK